MHIKKLEISGFKSFVDRTVIHFDEDVIGIVGPNGCGKSNIVDAIRWCMGEQSAKHLRGKAMSDVIFSGSESRGPHGMAEVTLTFDNTDTERAQALPLEYRDWSEIAVSRRLYRDGTSEYLINKTQVRLKDITELFLGTGVGTKAYSIIEQGKIGVIVSARAEDRRLLIEEAAGITKYKARKRQAEQKMDATRQNLLRVGDIVAEIDRNLASLKRQAAKAERYINYKNELEDLTLHEASHRYLELEVVTAVEKRSRAEMAEKEQAERAALDAREAELAADKERAYEAEQTAEQSQETAFTADNRVRVEETQLGRLTEQYANLETRRTAAANERHELSDRLAELDAERASLSSSMVEADRDEGAAQQAHAQAAESMDELRTQQIAAQEAAAQARREAQQLETKIAASEATLEGFVRRLEEMQDRKGRLENEHERLGMDRNELVHRKEELEKHARELADGKRISQEERDALSEEMREIRERAVELDRSVDREKGELSERRSRLRALEEIHARLEGVGQGVKALIRDADPVLIGLVADRFEPREEYTAAFAAAVGDRLQYVVVKSAAEAPRLLSKLADQSAGRATLIAQAPAYVAGRSRELPHTPGVVGQLLDLVEFAPQDEGLARFLFGDTAVVVDDAAAAEARAAGYAGTLVTREGLVLHADGRITGGGGDDVAAGMIDQKREIRELHEAVAEKGDQVTALLSEQEAVRFRMTEIGTALDRARSEAHQGELAVVTAEKDLRTTEDQLASLDKRHQVVNGELGQLTEQITSAKDEHAQATASVEGDKARREELAAVVAEAEAHEAQTTHAVEEHRSVLTERKVQLAQVRERAGAVRGSVERLTRSCDEMRQRIMKLDQEREACAFGAGQAAADAMRTKGQLLDAVDEARAAQDALVEARKTLETLRAALEEREGQLKDLRISLSATSERLREHEMKLQRLELEREHLLTGVAERFRGLELHRVVGDYHKRAPVDDSHRARISELAQLIDRMGPVNVDAVREHAEAEERHVYYTEQRDDLESALADLEKAIAQMNRESKRLFRETFDGINARFKVLFPRMFRGGSAELRLTNPDDMLETGIEILAQPPGKKLGNIELMSGGEKALTAVSLIFAIFQHKPSPFCILDEVDAPLDEANVARYNEAIRSMTSQSQFILITHIKRTMQSVDVLYGVTMGEPGVSRLVSVRVNEGSASRSQRRSAPPEAAPQVA